MGSLETSVVSKDLEGIKYVQSAIVDYNNILRSKLMTYDMYQSTFKYSSSGVSWNPIALSLPTSKLVTMESRVGELRFIPDSTLKPLPWRPEVAQVFGNFWKNGAPFQRCPRVFLQNQAAKATNLKFVVGFELEFLMLDKNTGIPLHCSHYCDERALEGNNWTVFSSIIAGLEELGIPIWQFHAEGAEGLFEVAIGPFTETIVEAADALVLARQAIYHIAAQHNVTATFIPKFNLGESGSGAHVHMSVLDSLTGKTVPEKILKHIIAGVLHHLPSILTILTPTTNSFLRTSPAEFAGAYQIAGTDNRHAGIRLIKKDSGEIERFELRVPDGTSNPYFMLGAMVGCGLDGLNKKLALAAELTVDVDALPEDERPRRLPDSFQEALCAFKNSSFIKELFGEEFVQLYVKLREFEDEHYRSLGDSEKQIKYFISRY